VKRAFVVVALALVWAGCSDTFSPPPLPDLKKDPYDFAVVVPPFNPGDMGSGDEMTGEPPHDLASND
jgi:hypothetical protein